MRVPAAASFLLMLSAVWISEADDVSSWAELKAIVKTGSAINVSLSHKFQMGEKYPEQIDFSNKSVSIWGSGATLDAQGNSRLFFGDGRKVFVISYSVLLYHSQSSLLLFSGSHLA